jgi:hypothetical protein
MQFLRRVTASGRRAARALKLDVASFFPFCDHSRCKFTLTPRNERQYGRQYAG